MFPTQNKIELFARPKSNLQSFMGIEDNWSYWGNDKNID